MKIAREYNHPMNILDIGGGFPGNEISDELVKTLEETKNDPLGYETIAEPGRYITTKVFNLLVRIIGIKNNN